MEYKKSKFAGIGHGIKDAVGEAAENIKEFEQETGTFKTVACAAGGAAVGNLIGGYECMAGGMMIGGAVGLTLNLFADR